MTLDVRGGETEDDAEREQQLSSRGVARILTTGGQNRKIAREARENF